MWIILIAIFLISIISLIDGIKNRSRFIFSERIKYYVIGFLLAVIIGFLAFLSSSKSDIGLLVTVIIMLTLILGNLLYYRRVEHVKGVLEMKFRILKYMLFSFVLLFMSFIITEMMSK
ncbi:hypothetical protein Back11_17940 [Paenibacillus baekrokdamisoli]|uniref:Uncharacterized protein n=1 Tax=Paenibacillus baekrokdamisoli TaxID=1712516 RepID=A0A3G9JBS1_9BACL|nr:hypothetical protein Back11_17940 [Paenibacillus baekrokdamisoli]